MHRVVPKGSIIGSGYRKPMTYFVRASIDERLGLTKEQAQMIVQAYGINWVDGETGNAIWDKLAVESWYNDLDHSMNHISGDASVCWGNFAFQMYFEHIASTSGQIQLLFNPTDWFEWMEEYRLTHPHLNIPYNPFMYASDTTWTDPQCWDPEIPYSKFPEMANFDKEFLDKMALITALTTIPCLPGRTFLKDLLQYLYSTIWWIDSINLCFSTFFYYFNTKR